MCSTQKVGCLSSRYVAGEGTLKGQVLEFGGTRGGKCRYWKLAVTVLWWKLQVLETGGIDTGGKCRYRKLQVQLTCAENAQVLENRGTRLIMRYIELHYFN